MELKIFLAAIALEFDDVALADQEKANSTFDLGYTLMAGPLLLRLRPRFAMQ